MRREIHEGLQVVEIWNSANHDLFYGKDGDLTGADRESQEVSMLALHLLQSSLVHINILLLQEVLKEPKWADRLTEADRRALSPLFWTPRQSVRKVRVGHEPQRGPGVREPARDAARAPSRRFAGLSQPPCRRPRQVWRQQVGAPTK